MLKYPGSAFSKALKSSPFLNFGKVLFTISSLVSLVTNLKAKEVKGLTSKSVIDRQSMQHLQPSSFADLMELLPVGLSRDPNLSVSNRIVLRENTGGPSSYWLIKMIIRFLSFGIKKKAKKKEVHFTFLFMKANGKQLAEITKLIESGIIKPVIDKVFPLEDTNKALEYVESGKAKRKVVVKLK